MTKRDRRGDAAIGLGGLVRTSFALARDADPRLLRATMLLQAIRGVAIAGQVLVVQWLLRGLISLEGGDPDLALVVGSLCLLTVMVAVVAVVSAVLAEQQRLLGELTVRTVWERILGVTGSVDLEAFERPQFYDLLQRVESQAVMRPNVVVQSLVGLIGGLVGAVGATVALLAIEPLLLPLVAVGAVPSLLAAQRASRMEYEFAVEQTPRVRLREYFSSMLTGRTEAAEVRAYDLVRPLASRYRQVNDDFLTAFRTYLRRRAAILAAGGIGAAIALAAAVAVVAILVVRGRLDVAAAGAAVVGARLLGQQVSGLVTGGQAIAESRRFLDDLGELLQRGGDRRECAEDHLGLPRSDGFAVLDLRGVSYRYPGTEQLAVDNVSLTLRRGEVVALVGENGSGKTSLSKLITGLLPVTTGEIRYDGRTLDDIGPGSTRRGTAVVFQDFVRYQVTARENIAFGDAARQPSDEAVGRAAQQAGVAEMIAGLPDGLDTTLSKAFGDGVDLSTGMWQRMALARAFFRDAPFMILDEPAASLDARAEHALFSTLRGLAAGRTVLFVSHRFATVRDADRIVVMHEGQVVEQGDHDALMGAGGRYAEMFTLQASAYADETGSRSASSTA